MDALSIAYLVNNTYGKLQHAEKFEATGTPTAGASTPAPIVTVEAMPASTFSGSIFSWIFFIIFVFVFGAFSSYLSWQANTLVHWDIGFKLFFSFFAFLSGFSYLITYLVHKLDLLNYIRRSKGEDI